jgi:hypothetical protein
MGFHMELSYLERLVIYFVNELFLASLSLVFNLLLN